MDGEQNGGTDRDGIYDSCSHCGSPFVVGEWYPVRTEIDDDGDRNYHSFCDDDCRAAWEDESVSG